MKLQGIFVDTATPFDHAGELYRVKIEHNIGKWNQTSVAGYVVGGLAGEGTLLTAEEKQELWRVAAANAAPGKVLIAGIQAQGVHHAVAQIGKAAALGYTAALVETHHDDPRALLFFRSVADRAPIPVIAPNAIAHPNLYSGLCRSDATLWTSLARGAEAAVLSLASAAPYACIAVWEAFRTREEEAGLDWQSRITPAANLIHQRLGVPGLKYAMDLNGFYGGPPRLPSTVPTPSEQQEIRDAFANLNS
jgi:4-hydroxy-2-oxoglutarate aldolase